MKKYVLILTAITILACGGYGVANADNSNPSKEAMKHADSKATANVGSQDKMDQDKKAVSDYYSSPTSTDQKPLPNTKKSRATKKAKTNLATANLKLKSARNGGKLKKIEKAKDQVKKAEQNLVSVELH